MNASMLSRSTAVRVAAVVLLASLVTSGRMVVAGVRADATPSQPPARIADLGASAASRNRMSSNLEDAIDNDLFSPTRTPPAHAFKMPGEPSDSGRAEPPKPVVLGTAVTVDGSSFATCQFGTDNPRIVRVGDRVGEYVVKSIARGKVGFQRVGSGRVDVVSQQPRN